MCREDKVCWISVKTEILETCGPTYVRWSQCVKKSKNKLRVVYPILSFIVGSYNTCHNLFKGWAYIEEITKLWIEDKVCWISVKTEIWGITISNFAFIITPPLFFNLHWFPLYPRQYTGYLVETIILHMSYSRSRPGFLRERNFCFWIQFPPGLQLIFLEWCVPFALRIHWGELCTCRRLFHCIWGRKKELLQLKKTINTFIKCTSS